MQQRKRRGLGTGGRHGGLGGDRCRCHKEAAMLWAADGANLDCTEIRKKSVLVSKVFGFGV